MKELIDFCTTSGVGVNYAGMILRNPVSRIDRWTMKNEDIEILKKIASCSYSGEICEALDKRTNQKVTVKSYAGTIRESFNEFLSEAEVLKLCNHANVIR